MNCRRVLLLGCISSLTIACASGPPPAAQAAAVVRTQCAGGALSGDGEALLRSVAVLGVEPLYSHILTGNNNSEDRVCGAKILVRPPPGGDPGQLLRALRCHGARALLASGGSAGVASDPYYLPEAWVTIEVKPEDGNFAILVTADTVGDNLQLLRQARKYGGEHVVATDPALP